MPDLWRCPDCGREFANPKQWHSCLVTKVDDHLAGAAPEVRAGVEKLLGAVAGIDGARVDPVKTGITLMTDRAFGYVTVRKGHFDLQLRFDDELALDRARRVERVGEHAWAYEFRLTGPEHVDEELVDLILEAAGG
jgi:hypothetical protein